MREIQKYQYWMRSIPGIGNKKLRKLVEYCGSAKEVYHLAEKQFSYIPEIRSDEILAITDSRRCWNLEREAEILERSGVAMTTIEDDVFPGRLLQYDDCPYALFYKGSLPKDTQPTAAIVGARLCSEYGRAVALELGEKLAVCGISVVSGMAAGIDSFGHWGAIRGQGRTYAVLGCGVDICYPKGAGELYERIPEEGGIISEYPPGTRPLPGQFPARNRIISAFSDIVIVVEAKKKSGSLITADFALEQGKEIYAVPGRLDDNLSQGCNSLIRQGAGIITSSDELLLELELLPKKFRPEKEKTKNLLEKEELLVYSCFDLHTKNMEELIQMTRIPASEMADILIRLQTKGWIEESFKNYYRKK